MTMRAPSGSNTYIPSYDATGPVVQFTRNPAAFRLNRYVKYLKVKKDQGYYLTLDADEPYRVVDENDYLWEDGADAPAGRGEKQEFAYQPYKTIRRSFPFTIGQKAVDQADWPILAAHARKTSTKAMTLRTLKLASLCTDADNWPAANTATVADLTATGASWSQSTETQLYIKQTLDAALVSIEQQTGGIVFDEENLCLIANPDTLRLIARSPEYHDYIKGSPDALSLQEGKNPNRKYGLTRYLYGLTLVGENAVRVTTRKGGTQSRGYIWPDGVAMICSRPEGLVGEEGDETLDFSTLAFRFYEEMTVESKTDPDNRREMGRCVEDYTVTLQAPQTGFLITGIA